MSEQTNTPYYIFIICGDVPMMIGKTGQYVRKFPHFHATYGGKEVIVSINELDVIDGEIPNKQLKMLLGWAAFHQEELIENWKLASEKQELFAIDPLK